MPRHAAAADPQPGERLVAVGALLFGAGVLAVLVAVVPFLLGGEGPSFAAPLSFVLLPVGFGLALLGLLHGARARRRQARRAARTPVETAPQPDPAP